MDDSAKPYLLIADDSPTVTGILTYIFGEEGFEVTTAADGVEAIRRFYENPPDLVVLDIEMPRMNGYQVCRVLKDDPTSAHIPVVVLTSRDLQSDRFRGLAAGADAYLVKNLEDDNLVVTVKRLLQEKSAVVKPSPRAVSDAEIFQQINAMLDRRLFISTVVGEVEKLITLIGDFDEARSHLVALFGRVFEFVTGGIALTAPEGIEATCSLLEGYDVSLKAAFEERLRNSVEEDIGQFNNFHIVWKAHAPSGAKMFPLEPIQKDYRCWALKSGGIPIGVLAMAATSPLKFDQEGSQLLAEFLARVEVVMDNARLIAEREAVNVELKQALIELRETQGQLLQAEKLASLGQLTAGLTHEMNNPLTFIAGNIEHLVTATKDIFRLIEAYDSPGGSVEAARIRNEIDFDYLRDDYPGLLKDLREGVERARRIISDLRLFSAMDRGDMQTASIAEVVDSTINILRHEWSGRVEIARDYGSYPMVECNSGQIGQVVMNLLSNAIKAIKEKGGVGGKITIGLSDVGENASIIVADNGKGIAPEDIDRLFQPFYTTRQVGEGMGLGLSITHGIIRRHGGTISVQSEPGVGTMFTITLPLRARVAE